ncbi:DMT family transporter [Candidatus Bipolaricaulota bacterium]|nr:DMT family transporter [Candidatus Bipolaricaulota bacterium]
MSWGVAQVVMKSGLLRVDAVTFAFLRPVVALLFIVPYVVFADEFAFVSVSVTAVAAAGGVLNAFAGTALYYYAVKRSPVHQAASLANTSPFWSVALAVLFLRESPSAGTFGAAALVVAGSYLLIARGSRNRQSAGSLLPRLAALGAGLLWGFTAAVPAKYCLARGMSGATYELILVASAGICWAMLAVPRILQHGMQVSRAGWLYVIVSSVFGFFVGWILWLEALGRVDASVLGPVNGATALFAFAFGVLLFRERPTGRAYGGALLIFSGVVVVSLLG